MAKVKLGNLSPGAVPLTRGGFLIRDTKHGPVAQAWPKKRGKAKTAADLWAQKRFGIAAIMAANPFWLDYLTAVHMVKGTTLVPRDWLMMCAVGKAYILQLEDGTIWPSRTSMSINPQLVLDEISSTTGATLYRESYGWVGLDPASEGYVLTMESGVPTWKLPPGGVGLGSLVSVLKRTTDAATTAATTHICTWQSADIDECSIWNPAFPTRVAIPAAGTRMRVSVNAIWTGIAANDVYEIQTKSSTASTSWFGSIQAQMYGVAASATTKRFTMIGPWCTKPSFPYFEVQLLQNVSRTLGWMTNSSVTVEVA
jgi:hypothetical protein